MNIPIRNNLITDNEEKMSKTTKPVLLLLNCAMLGLGNCGGPLVQRLYFVKGGKRVWLSSWLQTGGWPFLLFPILISYLYRQSKEVPGTKLVSIKSALFMPCAVLGILTGADDYLAAYGVSRLPVSTSALIIATQLAFTAGFAFILVKQKFTPFTINAVFLSCAGAVVLAFHTNFDRPANESNSLGASALYGLVLPAIELMYKKVKQPINYSLVMEMQAISREARDFELGKAIYYLTLTVNALPWQFFFLGATGVIF